MNQEQPKEQTIDLNLVRLRNSDTQRAQAADLEALCNIILTLSKQLQEAKAENEALKATKG
jgi:hypothetical protein